MGTGTTGRTTLYRTIRPFCSSNASGPKQAAADDGFEPIADLGRNVSFAPRSELSCSQQATTAPLPTRQREHRCSVSLPQSLCPLRHPDHLRARRRRGALYRSRSLHSSTSNRLTRRERPYPRPALHTRCVSQPSQYPGGPTDDRRCRRHH